MIFTNVQAERPKFGVTPEMGLYFDLDCAVAYSKEYRTLPFREG